MKIAVLSDIHLLGPRESERRRRIFRDLGEDRPLANRLWRRGLRRVRSRLWNRRAAERDAFFFRALDEISPFQPDWVVALGDYGGDTHGVGLSHDDAFESVSRALDLLKRSFPDRCLFVFGDHEVGKYSTELRRGGIRLASLVRGERELGLESLWHHSEGRIHLVGVNSTLLTLSLFLPEALPGEIPAWQERAAAYRGNLRELFAGLPDDARILLFCHDPSALGALADIPEVRARLDQVEKTVLGHLHSPSLLRPSRWLARLPAWTPRYPIARIIAQGVRSAGCWDLFRPIVCPATFGAGRLFSGGLLFLDVGPNHLVVRQRRFRGAGRCGASPHAV